MVEERFKDIHTFVSVLRNTNDSEEKIFWKTIETFKNTALVIEYWKAHGLDFQTDIINIDGVLTFIKKNELENVFKHMNINTFSYAATEDYGCEPQTLLDCAIRYYEKSPTYIKKMVKLGAKSGCEIYKDEDPYPW